MAGPQGPSRVSRAASGSRPGRSTRDGRIHRGPLQRAASRAPLLPQRRNPLGLPGQARFRALRATRGDWVRRGRVRLLRAAERPAEADHEDPGRGAAIRRDNGGARALARRHVLLRSGRSAGGDAALGQARTSRGRGDRGGGVRDRPLSPGPLGRAGLRSRSHRRGSRRGSSISTDSPGRARPKFSSRPRKRPSPKTEASYTSCRRSR